MIERRGFLAAAAGLLLSPSMSLAAPLRLRIAGSDEQGGLVIGTADRAVSVSADGKKLRLSDSGIFAFGFAYDRSDPVDVVVRYADGSSEERSLSPRKRQYDIQSITGLPEKYVSPPPDIVERIRRESAMIVAARRTDTDATWFSDGFDWPARGIISGVYGSQRILNGEPRAPHFGVDIAAPAGTPIHAPAGGIVSLAEDMYLNGGFTLLDHGQGVSTCYLHQSKRFVKAGDTVKAGQLIGNIGATGRATGPHLHWAMNWFQVKLDPSRITRTPQPEKN
jgi:murein DD-endopeptidase MepM/ murein hydrolase activator NlpD